MSNARKDGEVHLCVQDHGIGSASADISKLFTAYSRINADKTRYIKGTGLGLAIIQQISELHGGRVWVESTEELGSTFHVLLPLNNPSPPNKLPEFQQV